MAERRARILDAAAALLQSGDVATLTMRALSETAGVSVPTIYNLVGSRDEVFLALMDRVGAVVEAELATLDTAPLERCFDIADHYVSRITSQASITRSALAEGLGPLLIRGEGTPLQRYGAAMGLALFEAAERDEVTLITAVPRLTEHLMSLLIVRMTRWATSDPAPPAARLRAEAEHAVGITLAAVATEQTRPFVLSRVAEARVTLGDEPPTLQGAL